MGKTYKKFIKNSYGWYDVEPNRGDRGRKYSEDQRRGHKALRRILKSDIELDHKEGLSLISKRVLRRY